MLGRQIGEMATKTCKVRSLLILVMTSSLKQEESSEAVLDTPTYQLLC